MHFGEPYNLLLTYNGHDIDALARAIVRERIRQLL